VTDGRMSIVWEIVRWLSAASLGIFAGAMLTEGGLLVPFWRGLTPEEFLRWYGANADRLLAFFSPLTTTAGVLALLATVGSFAGGHPGRWWASVALVLMLGIIATFFVYFEAVNTRFATAAIPADAVPAELARWAAWHHARTVASMIAFAAALLAARQSP
jgi:hypothetical protein